MYYNFEVNSDINEAALQIKQPYVMNILILIQNNRSLPMITPVNVWALICRILPIRIIL